MGLLPKPHTALTDADVAEALTRAVAVINPLLNLLSEADPIGLRKRTHRLLRPPRRLSDRVRRLRLWGRRHKAGRGLSNADRALKAGAQLMNAGDFPGTAAWDQMSRDERIHWWVHRVGALNTLVVASPGAFGWLARVLPVGDLAGFVNHAIVLCALAREYGITDQREQVRMLAEVLCQRHLPEDLPDNLAVPTAELEPLPETPPPGWKPLEAITSSMPVVITKTVWQLAGILQAMFEEVAKRPHPSKLYRLLSSLPGLGAIATYFGERDALVRAAQKGVAWLTEYQATRPSGGEPSETADTPEA
ncbi:hypothetical protein [Mycobacterium sp. OTB74]|jgi:hypothetical protein|uniref:hypothetical protein n=1 Tax=Mycobacterium sp. OTB74 TaxID=1853452 RepID=UPI00247518E8|nr:hypothetical protein [Mycobacterium sp. OTB74]MDH6244609.1 hypothetical protein [Mycobacterium sp. OTB74]